MGLECAATVSFVRTPGGQPGLELARFSSSHRVGGGGGYHATEMTDIPSSGISAKDVKAELVPLSENVQGPTNDFERDCDSDAVGQDSESKSTGVLTHPDPMQRDAPDFFDLASEPGAHELQFKLDDRELPSATTAIAPRRRATR